MKKLISAALLSLALLTPVLVFGQGTTTIANLPAANPLNCTEVLPLWQGGFTRKVPGCQLGIPYTGSVAPYALFTGQEWWNNATNPLTLSLYDGSQWISLGSLDTSAHKWAAAPATSISAVNLNAGTLTTPQTGTLFQGQAADGVEGRYEADTFGNIATFTGVVYGGTRASPTALTSGTQLTGINAKAYNGSAIVGPIYSFRGYAAENIASGHQGSKACIATTPIASTTLADALCVNNDGSVVLGAPTGGDECAFCLNAAGGIFDNGTRLRIGATVQGWGTSLDSINAGTWTGATSITTLGTVTAGTWNGSVVAGQYGGTGVANTGKTFTLGANLATTGAGATTLAFGASPQTYTFPTTTDTLVGRDTIDTLTNKTLTAPSVTGTLATTGRITSTYDTTTYSALSLSPATGTKSSGITMANNGGTFYVGKDNSTGGDIGTGTPYAAYIWNSGNQPIVFAVNNLVAGTITSTGINSTDIGQSAPGAGKFTTLQATGAITTAVTGSAQCLQVNSSGVVSGSGAACQASGTFPQGYLSKLQLSTAGSSTTMTVAAGAAADSTNAQMMVRGTSLAKTNASWAVGASGCLDVGTVANTTWYAFYEIERTDLSVVDALCSLAPGTASTVTISLASPGQVTWTKHGLQANAPVVFTTTGALPTGLTAGTQYFVKTVVDANTFTVSATQGGAAINTSGSQSGTQTATANPIMPTNYTYFRRIGWGLTNGSAQWVPFTQVARKFYWASETIDVLNSACVASATSYAVSAPPGVSTVPMISLRLDFSGAVTNFSIGPGGSNGDWSVASGSAGTVWIPITTLATDTAKQIVVQAASTNCTITFFNKGYEDLEGER